MKTHAPPTAEGISHSIELQMILVPIDFSPLSQKALRYAARLARNSHAGLTLLHVIEPELPPTYEGFMVTWPQPETNGATGADKRLAVVARRISNADQVAVKSFIRCGIAAQEIVDAAKELDVDLIVIATHGYTGWKHFCIGSTAERVVRAAPCPVLVVREKKHDFI